MSSALITKGKAKSNDNKWRTNFRLPTIQSKVSGSGYSDYDSGCWYRSADCGIYWNQDSREKAKKINLYHFMISYLWCIHVFLSVPTTVSFNVAIDSFFLWYLILHFFSKRQDV